VDSLIQLCDTKTTVFISVEKREPAAWDLFFEEVEKSFLCKKVREVNKLESMPPLHRGFLVFENRSVLQC
jgi:hypothetical protein